MSTEKMRESFEEWHQIEYPGATLARRANGEYVNLYVGMCWIGWQASRAAIEVELPDRFFTGHGMDISWLKDETNPRYFDSYDDISHSATVEAIESLGLRVKP